MKIILRLYIAIIVCWGFAQPATVTIIEGTRVKNHAIFISDRSLQSFQQIEVAATIFQIIAWTVPAVFLLLYWDRISVFIKAHRRMMIKSAAWTTAGIIAFLSIGATISFIKNQKEAPVTISAPITFPTPDPNRILVPTYPATANQIRRATKANP